jgi:hypothetical protein
MTRPYQRTHMSRKITTSSPQQAHHLINNHHGTPKSRRRNQRRRNAQASPMQFYRSTKQIETKLFPPSVSLRSCDGGCRSHARLLTKLKKS